MYSTGARSNNSQNLKLTTNSLKSIKTDVQAPTIQIRSVSAASTKIPAKLTAAKTTAVKTMNCYGAKSKFTENKSTIKPFINNRGIRPLQSSVESTSLNIQGIKPQKLSRASTTIDTIPDKLSTKRDSRKDIYNSLNFVALNKKSESKVASTGELLRTNSSLAKAPNCIRSSSATTSIPLRKHNIYPTKQNPYQNQTNVDLTKQPLRSKNSIAIAPNKMRSLSATTSAFKPIGKRNIKNSSNEHSKISNEELSPCPDNEMAIQTNEEEILNHSLIVGDLKIMKPSRNVVEEIEKLRLQNKTKKLLGTRRKFAEHSARDEEHLNDFNEFLEKSYVSKKTSKVRGDLLKDDLKLIASMDELLNRQIPKIESITDIRARIKRKEQELLSLFDKVPNVL